ncbi:class I SAM-dependent methyltransferase [Brevibacterium litoralis]|uniref:class I SAM-dependent methyltransferase n=1 Tax=Brevibacterium litoralis TaxID=3138935 RepID=UPI0032EBB69F
MTDTTTGHENPHPDQDPRDFWEDMYSSRGAVWSGKVNAVLEDVVGDLYSGNALDLGCGEGGDVLWLARRGWKAVGIDISTVAVDRARLAAMEAGVSPDRAEFVAGDLDGWEDPRTFDLVTASFLQSPVALARAEILRAGARRVAPGGHLLVVAHAELPPWSAHAHDHEDERDHADEHDHAGHGHGEEPATQLPTPESEREDLALDETEWTTVIAELRDRTATGPDGQQATLRDSVVLVRRADEE